MYECIFQLRQEGKTLRQIANIVGITHTRVRRILRSRGEITARYIWPQHAYRIAKHKHDLGYSYAQIARFLNENDYKDRMGRYGKFTRNIVRNLVLKGDPNE